MNHLILLFTVILCMTSCNQEDISSDEQSWVGKWNATNMLQDDTLREIPILPPGALGEYINITIPDGDSGTIVGYTFRNSIGFDFELYPNQEVAFDSYGGSRAVEDKWGITFFENIIATKSFKVENEKLFFYDDNTETLISFTKPE